MDKPKFALPTSSINKELKIKINEYFQRKGLLRVGNNKAYFKAGILVSAFIIV